MSRYILSRLVLILPTLLAVAVLIFLLLRVVPGDIVALRLVLGGSYVTPEVIAAERARLGLDLPLWDQFLAWMLGIFRLDLGRSMWSGEPVAREIGLRLQLSLQLALMATLFATAAAIPLGVLAAVFRGRWVDHLVQVISVAGLAVPSFWLGILMILFLLSVFQYLPPLTFTPLWVDPKANLAQLIWPALAVGYRYSAVATRMTRSALLEVLREDYVRTAWAKGLAGMVILRKHALRNALMPVVTVIGLEFAFLIGGLVVTEQVFNLNGIGKLIVEA
ncbi:MAG: ABC transporter permease, partial [Armatimonadota bacterium]|nr:ABC transporter permease [Armatimonadota bacterium]